MTEQSGESDSSFRDDVPTKDLDEKIDIIEQTAKRKEKTHTSFLIEVVEQIE